MKKIALFLLIFLSYTVSYAHGYWLEVVGTGKANTPATIHIYFGEFENQKRETGKLLERIAGIKIYVLDTKGTTTEIPMSPSTDSWEGTFTPKEGGIYHIVGVNDDREVQDWTKHNLGIVRPIQYLRTTYTVENATNATAKASHFVDALAMKIGKDVKITVFKEQKNWKNTKVTIVNPLGWSKEKTTNEGGEVVFTPDQRGWYLVVVEYKDTTKGVFKDKNYEAIRYRTETTVWVE